MAHFRTLSLVILMGITPVFGSAETLTDALIHAYQTNPTLRATEAGLREVDEGVAQASATMKPQVSSDASLRTSYNFFQTGSARSATLTASLTASLRLYDGGQTKAAIEAARMNVLAGRQNLVSVEQSVLLDAVTAYLNVFQQSRFIALEESNVRVLGQQVRAARDRFEVGEVTRTDVAQADARLAAARSNLQLRVGQFSNAREAYKAAVGRYPGTLQRPPLPPKLPTSAQAAENVAIKRHPRIVQSQFNVKAAEALLRRQVLNKSPIVTGSIGISGSQSNISSNDDIGSLNGTLSASVPLYQGGQLISLRRQALAVVERRNFEIQQAGLITRQAVNTAYANWRVAQATITARQQQIRAARIAFDGVREEAKLGARTTLDALNAEQELLNARTQLVAAETDSYVAAYTVLSEMGLLTVTHLGLGIETYNPDINYTKVNAPSKLGAKRNKLLDKLLKR